VALAFNHQVDTYLSAPPSNRVPAVLEIALRRMRQDITAVGPILQTDPLLKEDVPVAEALDNLCRIGLEALQYGTGQGTAPANWKSTSLDAVQNLSKRQGDFLLPIAPAIQALVEAVPTQ
jgi:hypothetical protein